MSLADVGQENFVDEVVAASLPVLIDVWGPRCRPCLALNPAVEALAKKHRSRLKVVKLNANAERGLCQELKVLGLPTFLLFHGGKEVDRLSGEDSAEALHGWLARALAGLPTG